MKRMACICLLLLALLPPDSGARADGSGLSIDSNTLYPEMEKTYAQGYVPTVTNGEVILILPLVGTIGGSEVNVTVDLGSTLDSPFLFGNYSQKATGTNSFLFRFQIPLSDKRKNGAYPVVLSAAYLDASGSPTAQSFTVFVIITDGSSASPTEAPAQEPSVSSYVPSADQPELYITECAITPDTVGGDETFSVHVKVKNIGNKRARACKLLYGSDSADIVPVEPNNAILFGEIQYGKEVEATFQLKTDRHALAGKRAFYILLSYSARTGGTFENRREFLIEVAQPCAIGYDAVSLPPRVTAGETLSLPANVFNTGRSNIRNVTVSLTGAGLFPASSVFLGDIAPGEAAYGEMKVFIGMLSMTEGFAQSYGATSGTYLITYEDDAGETYRQEQQLKTEILQPEIPPTPTPLPETTEPVSEWWITALVGFACIMIVVAIVTVGRMARLMRLK